MATYYAVYDRSPGLNEKWAFCSTYTDHDEALERLRYEAASIVKSPYNDDTLIYLDDTRLQTQNGYEMRVESIIVDDEVRSEPIEVDEPAHTSVESVAYFENEVVL